VPGLPDSILNFRKFAEEITPFPDFEVHFKKTVCDHIIYRGKNCKSLEKMKTFIYLAGTAFINFDTFYFDNFISGLLTLLKDDYQVILPFIPSAP
jgi:hypothetical protein